MIKVGLIGCGFMGGMHAACYQALAGQGVKLTAVADVREEYRNKMAEQYGAEQRYATGMELIAQADVDVIDICLPTDLHVAHAVAAMKAGRNVFLEKPVCAKEEEMALLLETKAATGAKMQIGQVVRFMDEYVWLKQTAESGIYGKILSGSFRRCSSLPTWAWENWLHDPERSGTVAVDMHVHDVDFVRYLMGEPDEVHSSACRDENGVIEQIFAVYRYGKDVSVSLEAGWDFPAAFPFTAAFCVKFEKATVVLDHGCLTVYTADGGSFQPALQEAYAGENDIGGNISSLGGYYNELKYFVEGLQGKNELAVATLEEAINSAKLTLREVALCGGAVVK